MPSIELYNKDMIAKPNDYSKIKGEFYWFWALVLLCFRQVGWGAKKSDRAA
jgi:hypothetical protein